MSKQIDNFLKRRERTATQYLEIIEEMLDSDEYSYAESTLTDIYNYVENGKYITDAQIKAVNTIKAKPDTSDEEI